MGQNDNDTGKDHDDEGKTMRAAEAVNAKLEPHIQEHLGGKLKTIYQGLINDPIPDKFIRLLAELENKEKKG
jgi:hypothetical protein